MTVETQKNLIAQSVKNLPSIGLKKAAALAGVGVETIGDLFYYFPRKYLDRSSVVPIGKLQDGQEATVFAQIKNMGIKKGRRNRFYLVLADDTGYLTCVWFSRLFYWDKLFKAGEWLAVSGKITLFGGPQLVHPEFDRISESGGGELLNTGKIIPLYPSGEALARVGLDSRGFRRLLHRALQEYRISIPEILPQEIRDRHHLLPLPEALYAVHFPADYDLLEKARHRLAFDEFFFVELLIAHRKKKDTEAVNGISFTRVGEQVRTLVEQLPFELTAGQKRVLHEIRADMKSDKPMNRLLQGDVGSGKTVVAMIAILIAVENDYQAVLMAPTEILAEQHYLTLRQSLESVGVRTVLLIGGQTKRVREEILAEIETSAAQVVVGTHALIQENVRYRRLGLVIIDEQHRFGVMQRALLREKGMNPDVLVMTATPIPRTLSLTLYGDLDVSILDELPGGRKPIKTAWRSSSKRAAVYSFVRKQVMEGSQAFIVFPLVEESEKLDLKAAVDSYEIMQKTFFSQQKLGLLHGRMKCDEKEQVMRAFKRGDLSILVSTTVIEVGVDVPNATVMVIEHAERFGLTQLHQLRGRVGRGSQQSYCILIAYGQLNDEARKRLDTMAATTDGFEIAQVDLELRGPGEFFGVRQHGFPQFRMADVVRDVQLLRLCRDEAFRLVEQDPQLRDEAHLPLHRFFAGYFKEYAREMVWMA